jgi:hypothetical protein
MEEEIDYKKMYFKTKRDILMKICIGKTDEVKQECVDLLTRMSERECKEVLKDD